MTNRAQGAQNKVRDRKGVGEHKTGSRVQKIGSQSGKRGRKSMKWGPGGYKMESQGEKNGLEDTE